MCHILSVTKKTIIIGKIIPGINTWIPCGSGQQSTFFLGKPPSHPVTSFKICLNEGSPKGNPKITHGIAHIYCPQPMGSGQIPHGHCPIWWDIPRGHLSLRHEKNGKFISLREGRGGVTEVYGHMALSHYLYLFEQHF